MIAQKPSSTEQNSEVTIQQLNLGYNSDQDRLLLKVGLSDESELAVWLTNRMAKKLWQLLYVEVHLPTAYSTSANTSSGQALKKFKQELQLAKALQKMDFVTEYQLSSDVRIDGTMLATSVKLISHDTHSFTLETVCLEGLTIRINLTQEMILAMCNMLQLAAKEALWNIGDYAPKPFVIETGLPPVLH